MNEKNFSLKLECDGADIEMEMEVKCSGAVIIGAFEYISEKFIETLCDPIGDKAVSKAQATQFLAAALMAASQEANIKS